MNREVLCNILEKVGLSDEIVRIIMSMYVATSAKQRLGTFETVGEE